MTATQAALLDALKAVEPYLDAIVCYASTVTEHPPNALPIQVRSAIAQAEAAALRAADAAQSEPLTLESAPLGTKAPAIMGGHWIKVERGWKWCTGSTFPRPGGDWTGELIAPIAAQGQEPAAPSGYQATTPGYRDYVSPEQYAKFSPHVQAWYRPYWVPQPAPIAAQAGEFLPLLLRDLCRELGVSVPEASAALRAAGLGEASQGAAVTPAMARVLRDRFESKADVAAQAGPAQAPLTDEQIDALRGLDTASRVRFYEHDFYVLSNFSAFRVMFNDRIFDTSEAAYHYQRFTAASDRNAILCADSAHAAFRYAQDNKARQRPDWDAVKVGIMLDILRAKAEQHEYVRRKLLETGIRELVEDSWRDDFWGWGPNRDGKNMLGRLWMQVRAELRDGVIAAAPQAPAEQQCACGDRPASQCPGQWEPGCDLGANEKHAKVAPAEQPVQASGQRPGYRLHRSGDGSYAFFAPAEPAAQAVGSMQWPKARDLFLRDDMGEGQLRVLLDGDNDVIVAIWPEGKPSASVEFCNGFNGGGKSPETRKALIALMCAMERDGARETPHDSATPAAREAGTPEGDTP